MGNPHSWGGIQSVNPRPILATPSLSRCILWLALAAAVGCSDPSMGTVNGTLLVDGQAPPEATIAFFPTDGKSRQVGCDIIHGKFSTQVPVGISKVEISVSKVVGQKKLYDTPDSPVQPLLDEVLPKKYNEESELTIDVKPGTNEPVFDLKTK